MSRYQAQDQDKMILLAGTRFQINFFEHFNECVGGGKGGGGALTSGHLNPSFNLGPTAAPALALPPQPQS